MRTGSIYYAQAYAVLLQNMGSLVAATKMKDTVIWTKINHNMWHNNELPCIYHFELVFMSAWIDQDIACVFPVERTRTVLPSREGTGDAIGKALLTIPDTVGKRRKR
ncbi:MAG: hypothetical protein LBO05_00240 [Deltaproteobacteria bacterium]|jgi:hypothetical protein|nr:hypothetical protein [Deltaproteobacteria bacterium]